MPFRHRRDGCEREYPMLTRFATLAFLLAAPFAALPVQAALAPSAYESLMQTAPEAFDIEIIRIQKRVTRKYVEEKALGGGKDNVATQSEISAQARVLKAHRSAGNRVQAGDVIDIVYIVTDYSVRPLPGAGQPRVLAAGEKWTAYLERRDGSFWPKAYGASFQPLGGPVR